MGLDSVELVMAIEEEFDVPFPDEISAKLYTVGAVHEFLLGQLRRRGREQEPEVVFAKLRTIICTQLAIEPERVTPSARFVQVNVGWAEHREAHRWPCVT